MTATSPGGRRFRPAIRVDASDATQPRSNVAPAWPSCPLTTRRPRSAPSSTALHDNAPQLDVVVIDDGSTDDTAACAEAAGARRAAAAVQPRHRRRRAGRLQVRRRARLRLHGPGRRRRPARPGRDREAVRGARRPGPRGHDLRHALRDRHGLHRPPLSRRTGIHVFAFLLSRLLRQPVTDPTSGFRLYNRRAIALFARDYPHDYPEVEAVLMLHHHRLTMREVPVRMLQRGGGVLVDHRLRASPSTTWSRCCSPCSSASAAAARCREPGRGRHRSPRITESDGAPPPDRRDPRRRGAARCSCSSSSAGAR